MSNLYLFLKLSREVSICRFQTFKVSRINLDLQFPFGGDFGKVAPAINCNRTLGKICNWPARHTFAPSFLKNAQWGKIKQNMQLAGKSHICSGPPQKSGLFHKTGFLPFMRYPINIGSKCRVYLALNRMWRKKMSAVNICSSPVWTYSQNYSFTTYSIS